MTLQLKWIREIIPNAPTDKKKEKRIFFYFAIAVYDVLFFFLFFSSYLFIVFYFCSSLSIQLSSKKNYLMANELMRIIVEIHDVPVEMKFVSMIKLKLVYSTLYMNILRYLSEWYEADAQLNSDFSMNFLLFFFLSLLIPFWIFVFLFFFSFCFFFVPCLPCSDESSWKWNRKRNHRVYIVPFSVDYKFFRFFFFLFSFVHFLDSSMILFFAALKCLKWRRLLRSEKSRTMQRNEWNKMIFISNVI